jgi:hypothetical protein
MATDVALLAGFDQRRSHLGTTGTALGCIGSENESLREDIGNGGGQLSPAVINMHFLHNDWQFLIFIHTTDGLNQY